MHYFKSQHRFRWIMALLTFIILVLLMFNLLEGPVAIDPATVLAATMAKLHIFVDDYTTEQYAIIWQLRMLDAVEVLLAGFALGLAGAVMQGLLRNPLADPGLLGISSGIGFIVVLLAVLFGAAINIYPWVVPLSACIGGIVVVSLLYAFAQGVARGHPTGLVLTGVALNALFGAATMLLMTLASAPILHSVIFWELGGVTGTSWPIAGFSAIAIVLGGFLLLLQAKRLNVLTLGECDALHSGVNIQSTRICCIIGVALLVGASVMLAGPLAFVGLMVPHVMRGWVGADHKRLLWASALGGAILLLLANWVGLLLSKTVQLPLGVLIAFLGAPFFLWLLWKMRL